MNSETGEMVIPWIICSNKYIIRVLRTYALIPDTKTVPSSPSSYISVFFSYFFFLLHISFFRISAIDFVCHWKYWNIMNSTVCMIRFFTHFVMLKPTLTKDYFTNKVCSVGKSCSPRDVTQGNPLRPRAWGFEMRYFSNIYGDFSA